ncbi:hypothetical protein M885DRAFT_550747 [Pelagophyceae sp. CCMP2097]|nr:hypothetical protein M885DRAFT_550747 [Pelagophyceae sp. CCMP2097]
MSGWRDTIARVADSVRLDEGGALSSLAANVLSKIEAAQERLTADMDAVRREHDRFIAEIEADAAGARPAAAAEAATAARGGAGACDGAGAYAAQFDALPWETRDEARSILSRELMGLVLALSLDEATFTATPGDGAYRFPLARREGVVLRLLGLDANLARMHARLAPRVREADFWTSYFWRCAEIRAAAGVDAPLGDPAARDGEPTARDAAAGGTPANAGAPAAAARGAHDGARVAPPRLDAARLAVRLEGAAAAADAVRERRGGDSECSTDESDIVLVTAGTSESGASGVLVSADDCASAAGGAPRSAAAPPRRKSPADAALDAAVLLELAHLDFGAEDLSNDLLEAQIEAELAAR